MDNKEPACKLNGVYRKNNEYWLRIQSKPNSNIKQENYSATKFLTNFDDMLKFFSGKDSSIITSLANNKTIPIIESYIQPKHLLLYNFLLILQCAVLISANFLSAKIMRLMGVDIVAGALCFPITYSISAIIVELYGFKMARQALVLSITCNSIIIFFMMCGVLLPASELWPNQHAFSLIFKTSSRLLLASTIAIFFGDLLNSYLLANIKEKYKKINITFRILITCSLGLFLDSIIFTVIAHSKTLEPYYLISIIFNILCHKLIYDLATCSIIAFIINQIQKHCKNFHYEPLNLSFF